MLSSLYRVVRDYGNARPAAIWVGPSSRLLNAPEVTHAVPFARGLPSSKRKTVEVGRAIMVAVFRRPQSDPRHLHRLGRPIREARKSFHEDRAEAIAVVIGRIL